VTYNHAHLGDSFSSHFSGQPVHKIWRFCLRPLKKRNFRGVNSEMDHVSRATPLSWMVGRPKVNVWYSLQTHTVCRRHDVSIACMVHCTCASFIASWHRQTTVRSNSFRISCSRGSFSSSYSTVTYNFFSSYRPIYKLKGWAKNRTVLLTVCNPRVCWHRKAFCITNCSVF